MEERSGGRNAVLIGLDDSRKKMDMRVSTAQSLNHTNGLAGQRGRSNCPSPYLTFAKDRVLASAKGH